MRLCDAAIAGNNIPEIQAAFDLAPYDVRVWQAVGAEAQALLCQLGGAHSSLALPVPEAVVAEPADLAPSALVSPAAVFALHAGGGGAVLVTPVRRRPRLEVPQSARSAWPGAPSRDGGSSSSNLDREEAEGAKRGRNLRGSSSASSSSSSGR